MSSASTAFQGFTGYRGSYGYSPQVAGYYSLGFTFNLDGTNYTQCAIYTCGMISLGTAINSSYTSYQPSLQTTTAPIIAPYWAYMSMSGTQWCSGNTAPTVKFMTTGTAPNRMFVVQWSNIQMSHWSNGSYYGYGYVASFEARLLENSTPGVPGKVQFFYEKMGSPMACSYYGASGAHIGIGTSSSNYLYVKYSGSTPDIGTTGTPPVINGVSGTSRPSAGALYTFENIPNVQLSVQPKLINFGTVPANIPSTICVNVTHAGNEGTLNFSSAVISGSSAFTIVSSPPSSLSPGQTGQYCIRFLSTTDGIQNALMTVFTNGRDSGIQQVQLTGDAVAPTIQLTPIGENFVTRMFRKTRVRLGDTVEQGVIMKNIGRGQLGVLPTSDITGDNPSHYWLSRSIDFPLNAGESDTVFLKFRPTLEGLLSAKFNLQTNASNGTQVIDLVGVGILPRIVVTPDPMKFDSTKIGTSDTLKFNVCNPGSDTLVITNNYVASSDPDFTFKLLSGADLKIAPEKCREIMVIFKPVQMGTRVARFALQTNIPLTFDSPRRDTATKSLYYNVTGTGVPVGSLTSTDIRTDGIQDSSLIGVEKCRTTTITNVGDAPVTINSTEFIGASKGDYSLTGITLPYILKAKSSVTVSICAKPTTRGSNLVELVVTGSSNESLSVLRGTVDVKGLLACVAPTPTTAFDGTLTPHNVQDSADVTITNCGDIPTAYNVTIGGADAPLYSVTPTTSPVVDPNGTTTFRVYFQPTTSGLKPAVLNFTGANVTTSVTLNGTGACAILDPVAAVTAPATPANSTNTFTVTVNNSGTLPWTPGTPTITPSNAFTYVSATGTPIAPGGSGTFTFSFNPPSMNTFAAVISFPDAGECGNQVEINVSGTATQGSVESRTADGYVLTQNAPNPAMGGTTAFSYTVPVQSKVRIVLTDVTGKMIRELVNTNVATGTYDVKIGTSGLASGTYLYIMEAGNARLVRQLTISK